MCCDFGFIVPCRAQGRFRIILNHHRIFKWWLRVGFNLMPWVALVLNKRVSLSFEVLQPGIAFSSLAVKVLDSIFSHYKVLSTLEICCLVESPSLVILDRYSETLGAASMSVPAANLHFHVVEMASFLINLKSMSARFTLFFYSFFTSLNLQRIEES